MALLALILHVLTPPGFMLTARPAGPAIVICTGHGSWTVPSPAKAPIKTSHADGACAFAGHGVASAPPPVAAVSSAAHAPAPVASLAIADLAPGRGLAAPPPPSQGPPPSV